MKKILWKIHFECCIIIIMNHKKMDSKNRWIDEEGLGNIFDVSCSWENDSHNLFYTKYFYSPDQKRKLQNYQNRMNFRRRKEIVVTCKYVAWNKCKLSAIKGQRSTYQTIILIFASTIISLAEYEHPEVHKTQPV